MNQLSLEARIVKNQIGLHLTNDLFYQKLFAHRYTVPALIRPRIYRTDTQIRVYRLLKEQVEI